MPLIRRHSDAVYRIEFWELDRTEFESFFGRMRCAELYPLCGMDFERCEGPEGVKAVVSLITFCGYCYPDRAVLVGYVDVTRLAANLSCNLDYCSTDVIASAMAELNRSIPPTLMMVGAGLTEDLELAPYLRPRLYTDIGILAGIRHNTTRWSLASLSESYGYKKEDASHGITFYACMDAVLSYMCGVLFMCSSGPIDTFHLSLPMIEGPVCYARTRDAILAACDEKHEPLRGGVGVNAEGGVVFVSESEVVKPLKMVLKLAGAKKDKRPPAPIVDKTIYTLVIVLPKSCDLHFRRRNRRIGGFRAFADPKTWQAYPERRNRVYIVDSLAYVNDDQVNTQVVLFRRPKYVLAAVLRGGEALARAEDDCLNMLAHNTRYPVIAFKDQPNSCTWGAFTTAGCKDIPCANAEAIKDSVAARNRMLNLCQGRSFYAYSADEKKEVEASVSRSVGIGDSGSESSDSDSE